MCLRYWPSIIVTNVKIMKHFDTTINILCFINIMQKTFLAPKTLFLVAPVTVCRYLVCVTLTMTVSMPATNSIVVSLCHEYNPYNQI